MLSKSMQETLDKMKDDAKENQESEMAIMAQDIGQLEHEWSHKYHAGLTYLSFGEYLYMEGYRKEVER